MRRGKTLRVAKWAGLVIVVTLGAVWALSLRFNATWNCGRGFLGVITGGIHAKGPSDAATFRWQPNGVIVDARPNAMWRPSIIKGKGPMGRAPVHWTAELPFWLLALFAALPTSILWRLDHRRPPPGHCRHCGYNLTGLTEPRCPECGAAST